MDDLARIPAFRTVPSGGVAGASSQGSQPAEQAGRTTETSDLDPGQWKPTREAAWCQYARDWVTVKKAWDLSADQNEIDDLKVMPRTCHGASPPT